MTAQSREKFATQVDAEILRSVRDLVRMEGRQLQALIDGADRLDHLNFSRPSEC